MDEHNPLAGIDLDAWQPPAPASVADAVIARMRETVASPAHELDEPRRRHHGWIAAAVIAAAAGVIAIVRFGAHPAPAHGHGEVFAAQPSHVALGPSSVELERGAALRWQRDHRGLTATQLSGAASWRVAADDRIVIDAGATGASVEASGASLRMEVEMNMSDSRVLTGSAVAAAVVAAVTVIVYEGTVRVTSAGQTVVLAAGGSLRVPPSPTTVERTVREPANPASRDIAPSVLDAHRLRGDLQIAPDPPDRVAMQALGIPKLIASLKLCIDAAGAVSRVTWLRPSGSAGYDHKIEAGVRDWAFRPIPIGGRPAPVCTAITFVYTP